MTRPVVFVILQTGAQANGGLQSITEIMRRLNDHRPIILTNLEAAMTQAWRSAGFEVHVAPEKASGGVRNNPLGTLASYRTYRSVLGKILGATGARIVHANDPLAFQLSVVPAKKSGARITLNLRDTIDPARRPPRVKFKAIFAAADHVFYLSADMADRWQAVASNARRACSVTYSIVDPERFAASPNPRQESPIVLVPGLISPKKGQLEYIRQVVPALAARNIATLFAGDFDPTTNAYAADCASAAAPFGRAVEFLGYQADLPRLFARSNLVAVPSRHEGLMRGMIEAMSCGRPVVSFNVCSAREVIEHRSPAAGAVVPQGDYQGMAHALIRFATDPGAQAVAGNAGSEIARALFNPDDVVERYERVYRELAR